jgi:hypothetical protein
MKRPLILVFLTLLALVLISLAQMALAAPVTQEARPVIAQPAQDSAVRGTVQIVGTATHPQFQRYELYYAPWPVPSDNAWIFIGDAHFNQQPLGLLGTWDSRSVTDGAYGLRVRVVKQDGNYIDSDPRRVLVANTRPVESPTPVVPTDTPEPLPTEPPATPTIIVAVPTSAKQATPTPAGTPVSRATPLLPTVQAGSAGQSGASAGSIAGQLFSAERLVAAAKKAATYTVAGFVIIGLFFGIKAVLVWLWQKIRP